MARFFAKFQKHPGPMNIWRSGIAIAGPPSSISTSKTVVAHEPLAFTVVSAAYTRQLMDLLSSTF